MQQVDDKQDSREEHVTCNIVMGGKDKKKNKQGMGSEVCGGVAFLRYLEQRFSNYRL